MRHKKKIRKLSRNKSHRKSLIRNMAISFFLHKKLKTTEAKAKELKSTVEKIITLGKKGDVQSYRRINSILNYPKVLKNIKEIAEKYKDRQGGYTQIIKLFHRRGDSARQVLIKLVEQ